MLVCHNDGTIGAYTGSAWVFSENAAITAGNWYHVAWVLTEGSIYYYVNGQPYGSDPFSYTDTLTHHVFVGSWYSINNNYDFDGSIDEVAIYNRSFNSFEIQELYENSLNGCSYCSSGLISKPKPSNNSQLDYGTTNTALEVTTSGVDAVCKYSTTSGTDFVDMTLFSTTGATTHSSTITGLQNGQSYDYYIKCNDTATGNITEDYHVHFSIIGYVSKIISTENDFTDGSFSGLQLNIEPTNTSCIYRYISSGYYYYTSGQHNCASGYECDASGACFSPLLLWPGSTHTEGDCVNLGGTVYSSMCKYPGSAVPSGWTQAANWQRYSISTWGGDYCGRYKITAPTSFSNVMPSGYVRGSRRDCIIGGLICSTTNFWYVNLKGSDGCASTLYPRYYWTTWSGNTNSYRVEIGIY